MLQWSSQIPLLKQEQSYLSKNMPEKMLILLKGFINVQKVHKGNK